MSKTDPTLSALDAAIDWMESASSDHECYAFVEELVRRLRASASPDVSRSEAPHGVRPASLGVSSGEAQPPCGEVLGASDPDSDVTLSGAEFRRLLASASPEGPHGIESPPPSSADAAPVARTDVGSYPEAGAAGVVDTAPTFSPADLEGTRLREAFDAGITAVYAWGEEGAGKHWVFEEDCLHPSAKDAAYIAWLAQRPPREPR